jgi:hypothetical protein
MKKSPFLLRARLCPVLLLVFVVCGFAACKQKPKPNPGPDAKAEVLPSDTLMQAFSQSPPIVQDVLIKKLKTPDSSGRTVVLIASFAQEETRLGGINTLPLTIDDQTQVKLNDRGVDGDEKAGDGLFSIALKVSDQELTNVINTNREVLAKQNNTITSFVGRIRKVETDFKPVSLDSFRLNARIPIRILFASIITRTTLPPIRDKSLMIRDISIVEDQTRTYDPCRSPKGNADGVWSFKTLVSNMANQPQTTVTAKDFLIDWVDLFLFSAHNLPSGDASTNRLISKERLIKAWMQNSGVAVPGAAGVPVNWKTTALKVEEFPVRLLAIVNRLDLRGNMGYGGGVGNAGEGRFVFCFVDSRSDCTNGNNQNGTMTFILEYGIPIKSCQQLKDYGQKWWELQSEGFGATFNTKLEAITNVFTAAGANGARPNKSALNHFRSNDFLPPVINIATNPWDIRDFEIDAATHKLKIIHPNREPMEPSNGFGAVTVNGAKLTAMVAFANSVPFTAANPNPNYTIPDNVKGIHGPMRVGPTGDYHWKGNTANVIAPLKRREFSFNACSGCHKGETDNVFTHIRPRGIGAAAGLSGFMTGLGTDDNAGDDDTNPAGDFFVNDPGPAPKEPQRGFNEAFFRAQSLETLVFGSPCLRRGGFSNELFAIERVLRFRPLNMVH